MLDVKNEGLVSLHEGGWKVAKGEPDVRGWDVVTSDHKKVGTVDDMLADPTVMKVRYLVIDLDRDVATVRGEKIVRVPASEVRVQGSDRKVVLNVSRADLNPAPAAQPPARHDGQTKLTRADEELRIGKQQVKVGEVLIKKRVETERVREPVTLQHEEVAIERRPVTQSSGDGHARDVQLSAHEMRIPVMAEEAVVEKRPVVKEEIIVSKRPVEARDTVEADVRRERIEVERHGNVRAIERDREPKNV